MTTRIYAVAPISVTSSTDLNSLSRKFLDFSARRAFDSYTNSTPGEDVDFAESALDNYLEDYEQDSNCEKLARKMVESLATYFSDFIRISSGKEDTVEIYVNSEEMEYSAFEFLINSALCYGNFNTNKILVYGETYGRDSAAINTWEDCYSLQISGDTNYDQENHLTE